MSSRLVSCFFYLDFLMSVCLCFGLDPVLVSMGFLWDWSRLTCLVGGLCSRSPSLRCEPLVARAVG